MIMEKMISENMDLCSSSCSDEPRSGRQVEVTTAEMVKKVHDLVLESRRTKVRQIAETIGISTKRILNILYEHLSMRKLCAKWVPRLLTPEIKQQ